MDQNSKQSSQSIGLKTKTSLKPKGVFPVRAISKNSFRPSRSVNAVKSLTPIKVTPLNIFESKLTEK